jgi:hypothetical protein
LKWALLVGASLVSGCSLFAPKGPSDVARGEYYAAGKPEYDSFFIQLHDKQVELLAAPAEPQTARQNLAQAVGLTGEVSNDGLKERLGQEFAKLASQGLRVRLEVPEPSSTLDASATLHTEGSASSPLRSVLPEEATRLVRSRNRMLASKAQLDKLRITGITLDTNIDQAFRVDGPWKRDEVRKNLNDGQKVIVLMQSRAQEIADTDSELLSALVAAASTGPGLGKNLAPPPPPPPANEDATKSGKRAAPRSAPATAHAPPPGKAPAAATKPKRNEDDAPAPKPTQGSAPAEIEP